MKLIVIAATMLLTCSVWAVGDAGCGLGSLIISKNTKLLQLFAITTNGTLMSQTFGITSGTSNCSSSGIVMNDNEQKLFVENNYERLIVEMVQGTGTTLSAFSHALGCPAEKVDAFGSFTQKNYTEIMKASSDSDAFLKEVKSQLKTEPEFASTCTSLS